MLVHAVTLKATKQFGPVTALWILQRGGSVSQFMLPITCQLRDNLSTSDGGSGIIVDVLHADS